jgi:hypothetical protein
MRPNNVITAFLRVKLLGMNLLTIDARVVHAPTVDLGKPASMAFPQGRGLTPLSDQARTSRDGQRANLADAMRLLEEGSKNLDEARGMRARDEVGAST